MESLKKILLALGACLLTIVCIELVYSGMHINAYRGGDISKDTVWPWLTSDPIMGWVNKPGYIMEGQFKIDNNGLRIIESSPGIDSQKRLIVCMGDSGTFGIWGGTPDRFGGLKFDSFPQRLQNLIADRGDVVVNAGTIGYSSANLLRQYAFLIRQMKPQIIVVRVGHNDHMPSWDKRLAVQPPHNAALRYLYQHFPSSLTVQTIAHYRYMLGHKTTGTVWSTPGQYEDNLRTLIRTANEDGSKVILVDYPVRPPGIPPAASKEKFAEHLSVIMGVKSYAEYVALHEKYMQRMEAVAQSTGTPVVRTKYRLEDPQENAYSAWDQMHPNKHGMDIVAEEIAKVLRKDPVVQ